MVPGRGLFPFVDRPVGCASMGRGFASVDELFGALQASRAADDEGGLPILDHCLQCAELLKASHPDDLELQVAGLVHDLGWLEPDGATYKILVRVGAGRAATA